MRYRGCEWGRKRESVWSWLATAHMLKERKEDSNYCFQHPTAPAAVGVTNLLFSPPGLIPLSYMIDPGENAEVPRGPASEVSKAGCWERVRQRCEGKHWAGGQTGLQCSASFPMDYLYEILRLIRVASCVLPGFQCGRLYMLSVPMLLNHFLLAKDSKHRLVVIFWLQIIFWTFWCNGNKSLKLKY